MRFVFERFLCGGGFVLHLILLLLLLLLCFYYRLLAHFVEAGTLVRDWIKNKVEREPVPLEGADERLNVCNVKLLF